MTDEVVSTVRRSWLIFGFVLAAGLVSFSLSVDWSAQSWLDFAAFFVSLLGVSAVFIYASGRIGTRRRIFWLSFRWVFIGVVALQSLVHAIAAARNRHFTTAGTLAFIVAVAVVIGWIYILQWVAMSRLAERA